MQKIFIYDAVTGEFVLNQYELKLITEFNDLWLLSKQQCGCDNANEDGIGHGNSEAIMKFANYCKFVYLYADIASPYRDYPEDDKRIQSAYDSLLTDSESSGEELASACKKWDEIQSMDRNIRILKAAQSQVDELINYFSEEGKLTQKRDGKPIYKAKDIMMELREIGSISDELDKCEERIRTGDTTVSNLRGGAVEGLIVDFAKEKERRRKLQAKMDGELVLKKDTEEAEEEFLLEEVKPIKRASRKLSEAKKPTIKRTGKKKPEEVVVSDDSWKDVLNEL